jgi:hypothetical protein
MFIPPIYSRIPFRIQGVLFGLLLLLIISPNQQIKAQCTPLTTAVPGVSLSYVGSGGTNASGVAYNPNQKIYYAAIAGNSSFPLETFDDSGVPLSQTSTGFDVRGLWWNPNLNTLEANGYGTRGLWSFNLDASGYALNTGTQLFTGNNQPNSQSVGDLNYVDNEIWYYNSGSITKRNRATNALIGTFPITGLPVVTGNLNRYSVFYTNCTGLEIGVLDNTLKRIYFIDKATMAYVGMSQLPAGTVTHNSFRASWANDMIWLYDLSSRTWFSFDVMLKSILLSNTTMTFSAAALNNRTVALNWTTEREKDNDYFVVERSLDGIEWDEIVEVDGAGNSTIELKYGTLDETPYMDRSYYRLKQYSFDGEVTYSDMKTVEIAPLATGINVYPNPAKEHLVIEGNLSGLSDLELYNNIGQNVMTSVNILEQNEQRVVLNVSNLAAGVYWIKTAYGVKKVIKTF